MPYSEYNQLAKLKKRLGIQHQAKPWIASVSLPNIPITDVLREELKAGLRLPLNNEKARSENLISPVLKYLWRVNEAQISYFSGYGFNVDDKLGLNGNCDYLFSARPHLLDVENPVCCLVEAKNGVVDEAYAQCAAEMCAAQRFNEAAGEPTPIVYGCATNGYEWVFLRLNGNALEIDNQSIAIQSVDRVLNVFQYIINQFVPKTM
jgi:hypothetical protein